jgi:short-subunit dehydrogenase
MRDVRGLAILVTGASRGIGRHLAEQLARKGARLALVSRSQEQIDAVAAELRPHGTTVLGIAGDLTHPADRERMVATAVEGLGGLDALINNAGLCAFGEFSTSNEEILRRLMEINFYAPVEMTRLCLPHLAKSKHQPAVVSLASICGRRGIPSFPEHCATKFALAGMMESWRGEFQRFGVASVMVVPGLVADPQRDSHLIRNEGRIYLDSSKGPTPEYVASRVVTALEHNWMETVAGGLAIWIHRGARAFPWLFDWIMQNKVRKYARGNPSAA